MLTLHNILNESINNDDVEKYAFYDKFLSEDEMIDLGFIHHSKTHVISSTNKTIPTLYKIFKKIKNKSICNVQLYRGLYDKSLDSFKINEEYTFDRYASFTEHLSIAKKFSAHNLILKLNPVSKDGFPYYKVMIDAYNTVPELEYGRDEMIEDFLEEAEWIFNIGKKIKIVDIKKIKKYTIIEAVDV